MKRGTIEHPKMSALCEGLEISRAQAVGHLEALWHFTAKYAIQGDVGKWSDKEIASKCLWEDDPERFIREMVFAGWLDIDDTHRLLVHDWEEHAERSVKKTLQNKTLEFARPTGRKDSTQVDGKLPPDRTEKGGPTGSACLSHSLSHSESQSAAVAVAQSGGKENPARAEPTEKESGQEEEKVTWEDGAFTIPEAVMTELSERWPHVTHADISREIGDCATYHRDRKTVIKSPKSRILTWLKKAFDGKPGAPKPIHNIAPGGFDDPEPTPIILDGPDQNVPNRNG